MPKENTKQKGRSQAHSPMVSPRAPASSAVIPPTMQNEPVPESFPYIIPPHSTILPGDSQGNLVYYPEHIPSFEPHIFGDIPGWDGIYEDWLGNPRSISPGAVGSGIFLGPYAYPYHPYHLPGTYSTSLRVPAARPDGGIYQTSRTQSKYCGLSFASFFQKFKALPYEKQRERMLDPVVQSYKLEEQVQIYDVFITSLREECQQERMVYGIVESCPETPRITATTTEHTYNKDGSRAAEFVCEICHKEFRDRRALMRHMYTHLPRRFACHKCDKKFHQGRDLKRHLETVHADAGNSRYICKFPNCRRDFSKPFSRKDNAIYHVETVHRIEDRIAEEFIEKLVHSTDSSDSSSETARVGSYEMGNLDQRNYQEHEGKVPCQATSIPFNIAVGGSPESGDHDDSPTPEDHAAGYENTSAVPNQDMHPSLISAGRHGYGPTTSLCEMGSSGDAAQGRANQIFWDIEYYPPSTIPSAAVRDSRRSSEPRQDPLKAFSSKVQTLKTPPRQAKTRRNSSHSSVGAHQHRRLSSYPQVLSKILPRPAQSSPPLEPNIEHNFIGGVPLQPENLGEKLHAEFGEKLQL
ncbi:hypothetical protein TWF694_006702 [Orbilia ellipsospora]|uniref:C2H2-type domain-containing protein n=1 Tax=Orbilia ellipsospora TaxID=2528407 RepID=A0AAV9XLC3_9PEZI